MQNDYSFKPGDDITLKTRSWKVLEVKDHTVIVQMYENAMDENLEKAVPDLWRHKDHEFKKLGPPVEVPFEWVYPKNICTYCNRELKNGKGEIYAGDKLAQMHYGCWHDGASAVYGLVHYFDRMRNIEEHKGCPGCGESTMVDGKFCCSCKQLVTENSGEQNLAKIERDYREFRGYPEREEKKDDNRDKEGT